jgi:hypothetical protein
MRYSSGRPALVVASSVHESTINKAIAEQLLNRIRRMMVCRL